MGAAADWFTNFSAGQVQIAIGLLTDVTAGQAAASKALVVDANNDLAGLRDVTVRKIKVGDSSNDNVISISGAGDEGADRTLSIPALGGNKTMALIDLAQTFSAAQTFSNFVYPVVARTATADGLTTGIIAAAGLLQFVTVTSASADNIVVLPTATPGTIVVLSVAATGYELRTSNPATTGINGGTGVNPESAIGANTLAILICESATSWKGLQLGSDGTLAKVEVAA